MLTSGYFITIESAIAMAFFTPALLFVLLFILYAVWPVNDYKIKDKF